MKSKILLLSFLTLFTIAINYAQSSASQAGIAVQGIARDANNTALTNKNISLTFELYYLNASSLEEPIYTTTVNVETDAFGVFSYIIDPTAINNSKFANNQAYLRIKKGAEIISNEIFKHVPYAIAANNGVPTGSIMPFIGTEAPAGWAICNGSELPSTATKLIAMVGNNAPDLRGMFLRGAGKNNVTGYTENVGPNLKSRQQDDNLAHTHAAGELAADDAGEHAHDVKIFGFSPSNLLSGSSRGIYTYSGTDKTLTSALSGEHNHKISGSTAETGTESRPVNYGVNYIIKL